MDYEIFQYGVLHDNTIVKIHSWTSRSHGGKQELYFNYTGLFNKKKGAWAYRDDFLGFGRTKKEAKRV